MNPNKFTLLDKKIFILLLTPYLIQFTYGFINVNYLEITVIYSIFILSLFIFLYANRNVKLELFTCLTRYKVLKVIKIVFFILVSFKFFQLYKVFSSGIDYTQIRHFFFNGEDRFSQIYMNSKLILYIMFYVYPSILFFLFLNSLFERKYVFFWAFIFLLDGIMTGGRFNIYIAIVSFIFIYKPSPLKVVIIMLPVLAFSGLIQLLRGDAEFQLSNALTSIVHYHIAPVAIFYDGLHSEFITNIPGDTLFSGLFYILKPVLGGGFPWLHIQEYLQYNWVPLLGTNKVYNAFGNIILFSYWDFLYIGPVFIGFIYSFIFRLKVNSADPASILLIWIGVLIYFSSLKMRIFAPEAIIFLVIFLSVYRIKLVK